jgi:prepilin-type N-terminal cleavage/methylation domain-containing protein
MKKHSMSRTNRKNIFCRGQREQGVSLLELLTALALVSIVAAAIFRSTGALENSFFGATARNARSDLVVLLTAALQRDFYFRTQIDVLTGVGVYQGVTFDPVVDVRRFTIVKRDRSNMLAFNDVTYETGCETYSRGNLPSLPNEFCSSIANPLIPAGRRFECQSGQRMFIRRTAHTGSMRLPDANAGSGHDVMSAGFCVINADNEAIDLRVATAIRNGDSAIWKVQSVSIGEDMGRNGIEFVDN